MTHYILNSPLSIFLCYIYEKKKVKKSMEKTCDEILDKLPKLSEYRKEIIKKAEKDHLIERLNYVGEFTPELQHEWQSAGKRINENIIFYKNTSNVLINTKKGHVLTSLSALLLACCAYEYYFPLLGYKSVIEKLFHSASHKEEESAAIEAKEDQSGLLVENIDKEVKNPENKEKILEFATKYSAWGGAKTINRGDFWVSAIYSTFNIVQSRSGIHALILYFNTDEKLNNLEDNKLYRDTHSVVDKILRNNMVSEDTTTAETIKGGKNLILYGAPGTGKSYGITKEIEKLGIKDYDPKAKNDLVVRTTLHPEYEYSDFVGQLQPVVEKDNEGRSTITYKFAPGIFTETLKKAFNCPDKPVVLILEEMSRANVAGVFGDVFQLLDRDSDGRSEYSINNDQIANYIFGNSQQEVYIPANMSILGTVNTSDQNVFAMDTAFKRRFLWKYVSTVVLDDNFRNNPQVDIKGLDKSTNWKTFFTKLNDFIVNELELTEDKQIGAYFIKFPEGNDTDPEVVQNLIRDKLLQYLWQDVAINPQQNLFNPDIHSFSTLYSKFDKEPVFSQDFLDKFNNGEQ